VIVLQVSLLMESRSVKLVALVEEVIFNSLPLQ
jgi:hypothetical protein